MTKHITQEKKEAKQSKIVMEFDWLVFVFSTLFQPKRQEKNYLLFYLENKCTDILYYVDY